MLFSSILLGSSLWAAISALNPIAVRNNVFFDTGTNKRFHMVGVDYQPGGASGVEKGADPLSNVERCRRDAFLFQRLGVNTIRVYSVDNTVNHDECMSILNDAGIYVLLDVNSPLQDQHLNRDEPWTTYTAAYATHVFKTIKVFGGYPNTLGFFSGNELINSDLSAKTSPPYIKAITRDMKAFIKNNMDRPIPVGYSAADDLKYRIETATYMSCGNDGDGLNDFYAINSYSWCGPQTLQTSGYSLLIQQFSNFTLPLFFSEYGCNEVKPRQFQEVTGIYGSEMIGQFSGGLMYEFTQEANDYGLVKEDGTSVSLLADFNALQSQYSKITNLPTTIPGSSTPHPVCPPQSGYQYLNGSLTLPSLPEIQKVIKDGVTATVGKLSKADLSKQASGQIKDATGAVIANKQIKAASSSGSVGNLKTLFGPDVSGSATAAGSSVRASGSASATARSAGTVNPAPTSPVCLGLGALVGCFILGLLSL